MIFSAKAGEISQWAAVERYTDAEKKGPQRIEKPYKVKAISDFFAADEDNTIPTSIVIGLRPQAMSLNPIDEGRGLYELTLTFDHDLSDNEKPGTIVDGQHRVLGVGKFDADMPLNVVALPHVDDTETAFQFLVINNKASKVSTDHLRALALHMSEEELAERLQKVKLRLDPNLRFVGFADSLDESPFKGIIGWPNNPREKQITPPAAIEEATNYIRQQKIPEFSDDDMVLDLFFAIWITVKEKWPQLWNADSKLLKKVSIVCVTQFFVDTILRQYDWGGLDIFDPAVIKQAAEKITNVLEPKFWDASTEWTAKGLDTSAGRNILLEALEQMVRNARQQVPWHTDIPMVRLIEE